MPRCNRCEAVQANAEVRRSPTSGHVCKDKTGCAARRRLVLWLRRIGDARLLKELRTAHATKDSVYTYVRKLEAEAERRGIAEDLQGAVPGDGERTTQARRKAAPAGRGRH
jgi:hypothetical protein